MPSRQHCFLLSACLGVALAAYARAVPPNTYYELPRSPSRISALFAPIENEYYRVENFGFYYSHLYATHPAHYYPTAADYYPPGLLTQVWEGALGDFNGDGWQDVLLSFTAMPEEVPKPVEVRSVVLLNNRRGGLYYDPGIFEGLAPARLFTYRHIAADFNRDGIDDYVGCGFGLIAMQADGSRLITKEPIPLVMSQPNGKLRDATRSIEGQENYQPAPGFDFGHDLAVGDINGDGYLDIYQGRMLWLNDTNGAFRNATAQLPAVARPGPVTHIMSSAIGDLNGDGFGDIAVSYMPENTVNSIEGYIILSTGKSIFTEPSIQFLPDGLYGRNRTRHNHMSIGDINGDGRLDIVTGQTRRSPYYEGRSIQLIINQGNGVFVDETATRIDNSSRFGSDTVVTSGNSNGEDGEGQVFLVDVNGDGSVDIVDCTTQSGNFFDGVAIFVNDGAGRFTLLPAASLPHVPKYAIAGMEAFQSQGTGPTRIQRPIPVNLDKQLGIDWVGTVTTAASAIGSGTELNLYTMRSLQPLGGAARAPVITTQPASQTLGTFGTAVLSVRATGNPAPTFQWKLNGTDLPGQNHPTLYYGIVSAERMGTYTVVVTNSAGSVTSAPAVLSAGTQPSGSVNSHPQSQVAAAGSDVTFTSNAPLTAAVQWYHNGEAIVGATSTTLTLRNVQLANTGIYRMISTRAGGPTYSNGARLTVTATSDAPTIVVPLTSETATFGEPAALTIGAAGALPLSVDWRRDGVSVTTSTSVRLGSTSAQPSDAGIYVAAVSNSGGSVATGPVIAGVLSTAKVVGTGSEIAADIRHPLGNTYDQILMEGDAATITADPGQVTRISYLDLTNDIVQVEFAGAGALTLVLTGASGPATPTSYVQPTVSYMKGHAGIVISGANETTNVSVFSVGRGNAVNQSLFRDDVTYDGWADIAYIAIQSSNGKFGGVRTANASYWAASGHTGIFAPGVEFTGPVFVSNITASNSATPVLRLGSASDVRVTGGSLLQSNSAAVQVSGIASLRFAAGSTSHGAILGAQTNKARLEQDGVDVTSQIVVNP